MKAVLVIDVPKSCKECFLCGIGGADLGQYVCSFTGEHSESPHLVGCPLRPLPNRMNNHAQILGQDGRYSKGFTDGYNACLDDITGEAE